MHKIKVKDLVQPARIERWGDETDADVIEGDGEKYEGIALPEMMLLEGTPLLASPGGEQIGWTRRAQPISSAEKVKDAYRIHLQAPFGELDVWVNESGVSGPPPPPPPPSSPTAVVEPTMLERQRVAGDKNIVPDPADQSSIAASGKTKLVTTYKICIDVNGAPSQITMLKSSGWPGYDAKISSTMTTWRYSPYLIDGVAKPVCTSVTFIYMQHRAPAAP